MLTNVLVFAGVIVTVYVYVHVCYKRTICKSVFLTCVHTVF